MINFIQLLRNIGSFDSVSTGANVPLKRLTVIYAENGRGKTTLSAILRSLANNDPILISERHRLAATHPPHIVLVCDGVPSTVIFQNGAWNRTLGNIAIFDDTFVDLNVHSGLGVASTHRQSLHDLIIGAQAVSYSRRLQDLATEVERHNSILREKAAAIPQIIRGSLTVDDFCGLAARADIDVAIGASERRLAAVREQDSVRSTSSFAAISLPEFNMAGLEQVLSENLPSLDASAAAQVQAHFAGIGAGAEAWVADGMRRMSQQAPSNSCPFCSQSLSGSNMVAHYRAYFGEAYRDLKRRISLTIDDLDRLHGNDRPAEFERAMRVLTERRQFWSQFTEVPNVDLDTAALVQEWRSARQAVRASLVAKQAAPLDSMVVAEATRAAVEAYEGQRGAVLALNARLRAANSAIRIVQEQTATGNAASIEADLRRLRAIKARHSASVAPLCDTYLAQKALKAQTELQRDQAKIALDNLRNSVFSGYQTAMNLYLQQFAAGFRLDAVSSANTRGGPTCTYSVVINNVSVPIAAESQAGRPSFRTTLSAGDRNTLALAFFFASLDYDPALSDKIVVVDDPVSSLDEHRSLTTTQEIRRLAGRTAQVIVLSHSKPFLFRIWEDANRDNRAALRVVRDGAGSRIEAWDVENDSLTEHDRRHSLLRQYLASGGSNSREVAKSIRPVLEAFLRVASPEYFVPGTLLGSFVDICQQRLNTPEQILNETQLQELKNIVEYSNQFHHETNSAWETAVVNDGELRMFVQRTLEFTKV